METMQPIARSIQVKGNYVNASGLHLYTNFEKSFFIQADVPQEVKETNISLSFYKEAATLPELLQLLGAARVGVFADLKPEDLFPMYERGILAIVCTIEEEDYIWSLSFEKKGDRVFATADPGETHEVQVPLNTTDEYVRYTKRYYLLDTD